MLLLIVASFYDLPIAEATTMLWLVGIAVADEPGGTVACGAEDDACVTTGGLPGLCDADLVCVTADCYEDGETCAVDGEWGTCEGEVCDTRTGCATAPGGAAALAAVALCSTRRPRRPRRIRA